MRTMNYSRFELSPSLDLPPQLRDCIEEAWKKKYRDFSTDDWGNSSVEDEFTEILTRFFGPENQDSQERAVYMALAVSAATAATIIQQAGQEKVTSAAKKTLAYLNGWLSKQPKPDLSLKASDLYPEIGILHEHQWEDDSAQVMFNSLCCAGKEYALRYIEDAVYAALTGDAITSSDEDRRDVFNWWLVDALPSAYCKKVATAVLERKWPCKIDESISDALD